MRLNASKFGLLATGLLEVVAGQETSPASGSSPSGLYVNFKTITVPSILKQQEGDKQFFWSTIPESLLQFKEVRLHRQNETGGDDTVCGIGTVEVPDGSGASGKRVPIQDDGRLSLRQMGPLPPEKPFDMKVTNFSTTEYSTDLTYDSNRDAWSQAFNTGILYVEVVSENSTHAARSYSPGFVVVNAEDAGVLSNAQRILDSRPESARPTDTLTSSTTANPTSSASPTISLQPSAGAGGTASGGSGSGTSSSGSEGAGTGAGAEVGGGGLSPGAIAGIAVGAGVAATAAAAALAWFLCLRRRRRQSHAAGGSSSSSSGFARRAHEGGSGAVMMMAEKEAAAAGLAESRDRPSLTNDRADANIDDVIDGGDTVPAASRQVPYSPYTDHASIGSNGGGGGGLPGLALTTTGTDSQASLPLQPPHYQRGRGRGHGRSFSSGSGSRSGAVATPQPIESRYAHLVEEGMTEEEIRRLEEEERQLDAAIEEAGSRGTPPR